VPASIRPVARVGHRLGGDFTGYEHRDHTICGHARAAAARKRATAMTLPEGLIYVPGFLAEAEERDVLAVLETVELHPYVLHDTPSRRLVRSFGLAQVTGGYDAGPAMPIPAELEWLRERCAGLMGREPAELVDLLVTRYPPGAGIGWHRDAPQFGEVSGISLLAACRMRFRRGRPRAWETAELSLEPRSAYVLSGPARTQWQHHIPAVTTERWSMTFRTLREDTLPPPAVLPAQRRGAITALNAVLPLRSGMTCQRPGRAGQRGRSVPCPCQPARQGHHGLTAFLFGKDLPTSENLGDRSADGTSP
jgi:DNA oxidative demethylase